MQDRLQTAISAAKQIMAHRYQDADTVLLAGSIVRGEATPFSDLDLVVIYEGLDQARRESFLHEDWPVEAFIHDPATLTYFFEHVDRPTGVPSLANMVNEGIECSSNGSLCSKVKSLALKALEAGPSTWTEEEFLNARYAITDMICDLRAPRSEPELRATLADLYPALANYYFRAQGNWSAKGKNIPRKMASVDPTFSTRFHKAFVTAFKEAETSEIISLSEEILRSEGGYYFEGHVRKAPRDWRIE